MKKLRSEFRSLLDPKLRPIAVRCLLIRLAMIPAIIWGLPIIFAVFISAMLETFIEGRFQRVFSAPLGWLLAAHDRQYAAARKRRESV